MLTDISSSFISLFRFIDTFFKDLQKANPKKADNLFKFSEESLMENFFFCAGIGPISTF